MHRRIRLLQGHPQALGPGLRLLSISGRNRLFRLAQRNVDPAANLIAQLPEVREHAFALVTDHVGRVEVLGLLATLSALRGVGLGRRDHLFFFLAGQAGRSPDGISPRPARWAQQATLRRHA